MAGSHQNALHTAGATGFVTCELLSLCADVESYTEIGYECQELCQELNAVFGALNIIYFDFFKTASRANASAARFSLSGIHFTKNMSN